jgi:long-subunit acyl-CoA synthetase (AMP-forming)
LKAKAAGINLYNIDEVIRIGRDSAHEEFKFEEPLTDSVYMFCYTSGTTGDPKAV